MLLLPLPLGPTTPVIPLPNSILILSAKDLKPLILIYFKYINHNQTLKLYYKSRKNKRYKEKDLEIKS